MFIEHNICVYFHCVYANTVFISNEGQGHRRLHERQRLSRMHGLRGLRLYSKTLNNRTEPHNEYGGGPGRGFGGPVDGFFNFSSSSGLPLLLLSLKPPPGPPKPVPGPPGPPRG